MSLYRKLPNDLLLAFYEEIYKNINKGVLSEVMYSELQLIYEVAMERNLALPKF